MAEDIKAFGKEIFALIDRRRDELFELLSDLIHINSENFRNYGNERECAEYIDKLCRELGMESEMYSPMELDGFAQHPDFFPGRTLEERFNVTARWRGAENDDGLMLMAHHDTVEIGDVSAWNKPPLSGEVADGRIYGRGSGDDKYAIAAALFIVKLLKEKGFEPKKNLLFTAYCDEEHGGSHGALASVLRYPCKNVVNMDCKEGDIWHCASGGGEVKYIFHTVDTVDSARAAAEGLPIVLKHVDAFGARRRKELEANPYYAGTIIPGTCLRYMEVRVGNHGLDLGNGMVCATFYTDRTREEIEREFEEMDAAIRAELTPLGLVGDGFKMHTRFFHYAACAPDDPAILDMQEASVEATGKPLHVCGSCLSDLSVIQKYSPGSAYAIGIGRDFSVEGGAHQPNEFIEQEELVKFTKTIAAYVLKVLG